METVFAVIGVIAVLFVLWAIFFGNSAPYNQGMPQKQELVKEDIHHNFNDFKNRMTLLKEQTERIAWQVVKQYEHNPIYDIDGLLDDEIRDNLEHIEILSKQFNLPIKTVEETIIVAIELVRLNYKNRVQ